MLQTTQALYGIKLAALDGEIGRVKDFYFDDQTWAIRYVVADTGSWLDDRLVLLSPHAFSRLRAEHGVLPVKLRKAQVEGSPSIEAHKPVSRQFEIEYHHYYGWPAYWNDGATCGLGGEAVALPPDLEKLEVERLHRHDDKHLQSTLAVTGFHLQARDGIAGRVTGFLVDEKSWLIRELAVEAGHWYAGKEILIPTGLIERISCEVSTVFVDLAKADLLHTSAHGIVNAETESRKVENFTD